MKVLIKSKSQDLKNGCSYCRYFLLFCSFFVFIASQGNSGILNTGQDTLTRRNLMSGKGKVFIDGKFSSHEDLLKILPSEIERINILTDRKLILKYSDSEEEIIEITLLNPSQPPSEKHDTLQIRVNGERLVNHSDRSPLLVFDDLVIYDQNPNNIDAKALKRIDVWTGDSATIKYGKNARSGVIKVVLMPSSETTDKSILTPEFSGGKDSLNAFIYRNMVYPPKAIKDSIKGKVYVSFLLAETGKIEDIKILKGVHPLLDNEAVRIVKQMPDWKPGEMSIIGKFGSVKSPMNYTVPIVFKLPPRLEMPEFPGGRQKLIEFIEKNTRYPIQAQVHSIQGKVYVKYTVTKTGDITNVCIARGIDPQLDDEAIRVVKAIPKYIPGKINGVPVDIKFVIPIDFKSEHSY